MEARHPIRAVARRTGLSPHLIRMWERRYGAVVPARTESRQRVYTDRDIRRLDLLRRATEAGESIGQIASLSDRELEDLVKRVVGATFDAPLPSARAERGDIVDRVLAASLEAVSALNAERLESILSRATIDLGQTALLSDVLIPLM